MDVFEAADDVRAARKVTVEDLPNEVDATEDEAFELGRIAGYDEAMREVLLTHPHDGHGPNETCLPCLSVSVEAKEN